MYKFEGKCYKVIILSGYREIRKFKILLEAMSKMYEKGMKKEEIFTVLRNFEKDLHLMMKEKYEDLYYCFRDDQNMWDKDNGEKCENTGAEVLECGGNVSISPSLVQLNILAKDDNFNLDKIDDALSVINALVNNNIDYAYFGKDVIPTSFYASKCIKISDKDKCLTNVYYTKKVFSDASVTYVKAEKSEDEYTDKMYKCKFIKMPTWVFSGQVIYKDKKTIYLENSNIHTFYDFFAESFFDIDVSLFPKFEELYANEPCPSLLLAKKSK